MMTFIYTTSIQKAEIGRLLQVPGQLGLQSEPWSQNTKLNKQVNK